MGGRFNIAYVQLIEFFDVVQRGFELGANGGFLFGGKTNTGKKSHVLHIDLNGCHGMYIGYYSSNLRLRRASISATACVASAPIAWIFSRQPGPAASIINPMMLFPLTRS